MPIKIAFIGAGSLGFTRLLVRDILSVPELAGTHLVLMDPDPHRLEMISRLCGKDVERNNLPTVLQATDDRAEALQDAHFVINLARIGGLAMLEHDIEIPLRYGINQCIGDTLCAGGIMYAQRTIPYLMGLCRDMRRYSQPDALLINYANPMAMNMWAISEGGGVRAVGLCHGVRNTHNHLADVLGVPADELRTLAAGINHQAWFLRIEHEGRPIGQDELLAAFKRHDQYRRTEKVRIDVLRRFGYYSTESNGHLSEYLPWYRKRPHELSHWIAMDWYSQGETAGYLRRCRELNLWFEEDFNRLMAAEDTPLHPTRRSHEHGSYIIEAIALDRLYAGYANVRNDGLISNLPADCVVEVPTFVDGRGVHPTQVGTLPLACAATCTNSVNVQRMATMAAITGDVTLLKQSMLHDPLIAAVCNPREVWMMADELLLAEADFLPQYRDHIAAVRQRIEQSGGLRVSRHPAPARLADRPLEQLRRDGGIPNATTAAPATDALPPGEGSSYTRSGDRIQGLA